MSEEILTIFLRIAGGGLILLAAAHIPIGRQLKWREDAARLAPVNAAVFHVHTLFICVVLLLMALPCLIEPRIFLVPTRAGLWLCWSHAAFWTLRLYAQWFIYQADLWRGKAAETTVHIGFTLIWSALAALFALCAVRQSGWMA